MTFLSQIPLEEVKELYKKYIKKNNGEKELQNEKNMYWK